MQAKRAWLYLYLEEREGSNTGSPWHKNASLPKWFSIMQSKSKEVVDLPPDEKIPEGKTSSQDNGE